MSVNRFSHVLGLGLAALLAGCGLPRQSEQPPIAQPGTMREHQFVTETVIHSFAGPPDGYEPAAGLLNVGGTLYGTTTAGGDIDDGMVFQIRNGVESVLYNFTGRRHGYAPNAGLIDVNGTLYGTTSLGGSHKCRSYQGWDTCGTVYSLSTKGEAKLLYRFKAGSNGRNPAGGLTQVGRDLYGTTRFGGRGDDGTIYKIGESGSQTVLHRFNGTDGEWPAGATFTQLDGKLYSVVRNGGAYGFGAVFTLTRSGEERVLYSFGGRGSDGRYPNGTLSNAGGVLYGTTQWGGAHGFGTVFKITTSGTETVLHTFYEPKDGGEPSGGLIDVSGRLYGTTCGAVYQDYGTFFSITKSGTETVLFRFNGSDGWCPTGNLIDVGGTFYGVTFIGGAFDSGTVYSVTP